jgi:hypothetical protein
MNTPTTVTLADLEPLVPAILRHKGPMFTRDVAELLNVSTRTIEKAAVRGKLEAQGAELDGDGQRGRVRTFDKLSLLRFLWINRTGDKSALLTSLRQHCPALVSTITDGAATGDVAGTNIVRPQFGTRRPATSCHQHDFWEASPAPAPFQPNQKQG